MQDKLQELTDKLYQEGLMKGKTEGDRILADARRQAEGILKAARDEAAAIVAAAEKSAEDLRSKARSDVRMASSQALQATRADIENLIVARMGGDKVSSALSDTDFVKEIIAAVAKNFSSEEARDLELVLPESLKAGLESWVREELPRIVGREIHAGFSKKLPGGFTIAPREGGYFVSLSEETFKGLVAEYLRPVTRKILFGE